MQGRGQRRWIEQRVGKGAGGSTSGFQVASQVVAVAGAICRSSIQEHAADLYNNSYTAPMIYTHTRARSFSGYKIPLRKTRASSVKELVVHTSKSSVSNLSDDRDDRVVVAASV